MLWGDSPSPDECLKCLKRASEHIVEIGFYEIITAIVVILTLLGIRVMNSPKTAVLGNRIASAAMLIAVVTVLIQKKAVDAPLVIVSLIAGSLLGLILARRITMIRIPQLVALFNGFGGLASLLVALVLLADQEKALDLFSTAAGKLTVLVGAVTFSGSMIAAGKLDKKIDQKPVILRVHNALVGMAAVFILLFIVLSFQLRGTAAIVMVYAEAAFSLLLGILLTIRIGGADMPIAISLLNSFSGIAASICGFSISDPLLIAVGAIVGSAGFILTRIMCRSMNRSLVDILMGRTSQSCAASVIEPAEAGEDAVDKQPSEEDTAGGEKKSSALELLREAEKVVIVPGYGMALSQAQGKVKELYDFFVAGGRDVKFAIHPVAGRMPGHMNVLLAEVDIPYDILFDIDDVNPLFKDTALVVIVGACDVVNPAAITAEGTPIYGMPILNVHEAQHVIVCNLDTEPGYSGVENPLYEKPNVIFKPGNAADTLGEMLDALKK